MFFLESVLLVILDFPHNIQLVGHNSENVTEPDFFLRIHVTQIWSKEPNGLKMKFFIFFKKFDHIAVMCLKSNGMKAFKGKIISCANSTPIKIFVLTLIPSMLLAYKTLREKV